MTQCPNLCIVLAALLPVLVFIILIQLPKEKLVDDIDSEAPVDPYLQTAWIFLVFLIVTLICATCCLCKVHFRTSEVRRLDSEIGAHNSKVIYDGEGDEEFATYAIGDMATDRLKKLKDRPNQHEKLSNNDRRSNQGSARANSNV